MAIVTFAAGDKDYISKLNQMSQNAGDTAQLKADTEQLKADTQTILDQTNTVKTETEGVRDQAQTYRDQAQAITTSGLLFVETSGSYQVKHGDLILANVAGTVLSLDDFKTSIAVGQWFTVENTSDNTVFVVSRSDLSLVGKVLTVTNGDRFGISPGNSFTFRAISTTELRIR